MSLDHAQDDVTIISDDLHRKAWIADEKAKWLTRQEAAYVLGTTPKTIDRMLYSDPPKIKHRREGRLVRIHIDDLRP